MMKARVASVVGLGLALLLAGCGGYQSLPFVVRSFIVPCPAINYQSVAWSPDGKHIAFLALSQRDRWQIYLINPDGTGIRQLTSQPFPKSAVQWLPGGQALSYSSGIWTTGFTPSTVTLDGAEAEVRLTVTPVDPLSWSPDGSKLAYGGLAAATPHNVDVYSANPDGSRNTRLTNDPGEDFAAAWSPDGKYIAYLHSEGSAIYPPGMRTYLYLMRSDGSDQRQIASDVAGGIQWSPDGTRLAFVAYGNGGSEIHRVNVDGSSEARITVTISSNGPYSWLPDGRHISLLSAGPDFHLIVIDVDTLKTEELTRFDLLDRVGPPSWSPDGKRVVFIGYDHSNPNVAAEEIYVMNRDGSGLVRLTDNPGKQYCLNWPF